MVKGSILGWEAERHRSRHSRARHALAKLLKVIALRARLEPQPTQAGISALQAEVGRLVKAPLQDEDDLLAQQLAPLREEIRRVATEKTVELDTLRRESEAEIAYLRAEISRLGFARKALQQERDRWQQEAERFRELHRQDERRGKRLEESLRKMVERVQQIWPPMSDRPQPDQHDLMYLRKGHKSPILRARFKATGRGQ